MQDLRGNPRIDAIQNRIWFTPMIFVAFILLGLVFSLRSKALLQDIKDFFGINHRRSVSDAAPAKVTPAITLLWCWSVLFNISLLALFAVVRNSPIHTTSYEISLARIFRNNRFLHPVQGGGYLLYGICVYRL
jgi:hypothetical protein